MRIDPDHAKVLSDAFSVDATGKEFANFDIEFMKMALFRMNAWERGLFVEVLFRAAAAKRKTKAQRAMLALFVHREARDA